MSDFREHARGLITRALEGMPPDQARDAYVVSLLVYDEEDDPRFPTITVGFNTETHARETTPDAEDEDEARWNYAYWLQNELAIVGDSERDPQGAALRREWLEGQGLWYDDDEEDDRDEPDEDITGAFVALVVEMVQELHESGLVERVFGRPIPVLVHELEYYGEIADQNREANPPGLTDDFAAWIDAMY